MRQLLLSAFILCMSIGVKAENTPLWLRYSAISPDGSEIAFTYKGDIYKVSSSGGRAKQLTTHPAHDTRPVWSLDGKQIAFGSNREGAFDLHIMSAEGGEPTRLTNHSGGGMPITFIDNDHILFQSSRMADAADGTFPVFAQIYKINVKGGRPTQFSSLIMEDISVHPTEKKVLYHDNKGYEDKWRKHHESSITRDVWLHDFSGKPSYTKLTTYRGENRNPVWAPNGTSFYYLSEEDGASNVYKRNLDGSGKKQLTKLENHPVRFLTASNTGKLCFGYDGEIYTLNEGEQPKKVNIEIITDKIEKDVIHRSFSSGATQMAVSPDGDEIAFIVRGDVFVTSVEYGTTRRITNTPEQERNVSFSPDGRSILYSAERNGIWNVYRTKLTRKEDKQFLYAQEFEEEQITKSDIASFQPLFSPDGKEVAYLEDRTTIRVINLKSKKIRTVLKGDFNYSYSDGDLWYEWSPDSKWILTKYIGIGGWNNVDVALVKADGSGELTNLTESGYTDTAGSFVQDGKAMLWFSDRAGYRSHGSWGAHMDVYIMFFDREAYDKFRMTKEELAIHKELNKEDKDEEKEDDKKDKKKDKKKEEKVKPLTFEFENRKELVIRLTPNSSSIADAYLNKEGDKLYYLTRFEKGYDLWLRDLKDQSTRILVKDAGAGRLHPDKEGKNLYMLSGGQFKKIDIASGKVTPITMSAKFDYRPAQEREYIFNHAWQQVKDKFYVTDLHGVDWDMYKKAYSRFLPHINNNFDFQNMLSELLGELNASHTGARYSAGGPSRPTAALGAFYDPTHKGDGLKIKEVINMGPLSGSSSKFKEGSIILEIDGKPIKEGEDYAPLLEGKVNTRTLITYKPNGSGKSEEVWVKPISYGAQSQLLYKRWVDQRKEMVDKLSDGRIGYVHVRGMDSNSFREVYSELLGKYRNREAVVIDTRYNGGGWLHDDLATLLSGKEYQQFTPRGQYVGSDPFNKWLKPSIVVMNESNYSNAHGFPWLYKELGIGKLVGAPVQGTMTAVWWETQIDPSIVFGIPQVTVQDMEGNHLENLELFPDIEVYNDPISTLEGKDLQIERAVQELLNDLK